MDIVVQATMGFFLVVGSFFALTGSMGMLRMPDFYTRLHAAGKTDTLAQACIMIGLLIPEVDPHVAIKLLLITAFIFITSPTATHAITKAAHLDGAKPWRAKESLDD